MDYNSVGMAFFWSDFQVMETAEKKLEKFFSSDSMTFINIWQSWKKELSTNLVTH